MESLPEQHEISLSLPLSLSLSEVCIRSLEGAHEVKSATPPPRPRSHWREFAIALCFYFA